MRCLFGCFLGGFPIRCGVSRRGEAAEKFLDASEIGFLAEHGLVARFFFDFYSGIFIVCF